MCSSWTVTLSICPASTTAPRQRRVPSSLSPTRKRSSRYNFYVCVLCTGRISMIWTRTRSHKTRTDSSLFLRTLRSLVWVPPYPRLPPAEPMEEMRNQMEILRNMVSARTEIPLRTKFQRKLMLRNIATCARNMGARLVHTILASVPSMRKMVPSRPSGARKPHWRLPVKLRLSEGMLSCRWPNGWPSLRKCLRSVPRLFLVRRSATT